MFLLSLASDFVCAVQGVLSTLTGMQISLCVYNEVGGLMRSLLSQLQEEPGNLAISFALKTFEAALAHPERFGACAKP